MTHCDHFSTAPKKRTAFLLLALLTCLSWVSNRNLQALSFVRLSQEDGLSHNSVYSITQDAQGFMWFGTEYGLNRFDGYKMQVFLHEDTNPNSLTSSNFGKILTGRDQMMWLGTWGGGLNRYNLRTGTFKHYLHNPGNLHSISQNRIECIFRDSRGTLWIGTEEEGLNRYVENSDRFLRYQHDPDDPDSLSDNNIKAVCEDDKGNLWVGTNFGLNRYDAVRDNFVRYFHQPGNADSLSSNRIRDLTTDKDGILWVGTRGGGLNRFQTATGACKTFKHNPDDPSSISDDEITRVFIDSNGTLWVGTYNGGLNVFDRADEEFTAYLYDSKDSNSLSHNRVEVIFEDRGKVLWVGTRGGGINRLDLKPAKFRNYIYSPHQKESLSHPIVTAITRDPDQEVLWIGTDGAGISRLKPAAPGPAAPGPTAPKIGLFTHFLHDPKSPDTVGSNRIRSLYFDRQGNLWVGCYTMGVDKMVPMGRDKFHAVHYRHDASSPYSLSSNRVQFVFQDNDDDIWVGTNQGLNLLVLSQNPENFRFKRFLANASKNYGLSGNYVSTMYQDSQNRLWVGTYDGLNLLDKKTFRFVCYQSKPGNAQRLSNNQIQVIYEAPLKFGTSYLWIGTSEGLNRFEPRTGTFRHYTTADGLPANRIASIQADEKGIFWIATSRGLSRFDPVTEQFRNYGIPDGLPGSGFLQNAAATCRDGRIFLCCNGGLVSFAPGDVLDNPFVPMTVLTSIKIFNREINSNVPISQLRQLDLRYDENFISFEFAALDYSNPSRNAYQYKLTGIDQDWIYSDTRHFAGYPNLPPGDYTFHIKGANNDRVWDTRDMTFHVMIKPPFWLRWWFKLAAAILFFCLIFLGYRSRLNIIKKRNLELRTHNTRLQAEIDKRRKAEEALRESGERLDRVIHHASMILWALDRNGVITFADGRGLQALGFKPGEMTNKSFFELYADIPELKAGVEKALNGETIGLTVSIAKKTYETRLTPIYSRSGEINGVTCVAIDETDRKRAEREKSDLSEQLRHVQKLETIGTLAGGIAHDFNNILGPILGYTEMALEEIPVDNVAVKWLESVVEASCRAKDLVQQILVFGRRDKQECKPVLIQMVIKEALTLIRASFPTTIEIHQGIAANCRPVLADPTQIHQIFMNLCTNAKHAMQETGGRLFVQLREVELNESETTGFTNLPAGRYVRLTVRDTGTGMSEVTRQRLFEPFYTTKKAGEGSGMGLSVVQGIVMGHDGEITVDSEPGLGAEFNVYLPAVNFWESDELKKTEINLKGNEHILMVDDEESMAVMGKLMLEQLGYRITVFTASQQALDRFKEERGQFDLVITDQTMPGITGIQLADAIKKIQPAVPVIIVSGFSEYINQDNFHQFGVSAYVSKPFNSHSLGRVVREVLDA